MIPKPPACDGCPFAGNEGFVPPLTPPGAKIMFIGEAPGQEEVAKGEPFIGPTGQMLRTMTRQAGLNWEEIYVTNTLKCRPYATDGKNRTPTHNEIATCTTRHLQRELSGFTGHLVIPVGEIARQGLVHLNEGKLSGTVTSARGYVHPGRTHKILPIVHPSYVAHGNPEFWSVTVCDLKKAKREAETKDLPVRNFTYEVCPNIKQIQMVVRNLSREPRKLVIDLETIGINPARLHIRCVGIAWSKEDAICIPFLRQGGYPWWTYAEEELEAWKAVIKLVTDPRHTIITQNGFAFDFAVLEAKGIPVLRSNPNLVDTLIMQHGLYAELPKSLEFLTSVYTNRPSYKAEMKALKDEHKSIWIADDVLQTYCLDDCTGTFEVYEALCREYEREQAEHGQVLVQFIEDVIKPLQFVVFRMQQRGMTIDMDLMRELHTKATAAMAPMNDAFARLLDYPFNPNSHVQIRELIEQVFGTKLETTGKLDLVKVIRRNKNLEPLIKGILNYKAFSKDRGTYLTLKPDQDGKIRSTFLTYGTVTYRLSSRDPDLQNIPRTPRQGINIKNIYKADPGRRFYTRDYSQLEMRIPAYASRCQKLIDIFESGQDYYNMLAEVAFQRPCTPKSADRRSAKTFALARGYGASPLTISNHILKATYEYVEPAYIKKILERWDVEMPEIQQWRDDCVAVAMEKGEVYDGFGVPYRLFGRKEDYRQIAISRPTQATASGIVNRAMVRIADSGIMDDYDCHLCLQVHDELMFDCPDPIPDDFKYYVKANMEHPCTIFGYDKWITFPTEAKSGYRWGEMTEDT